MDEAVFHRAVPLESPLDLVVDDVPADATFLGEEALSGSFATVQRHEDTAVDTAEVIEEDFMIRMIKPDAFKVQDNYLTPQRYAEELAARAYDLTVGYHAQKVPDPIVAVMHAPHDCRYPAQKSLSSSLMDTTGKAPLKLSKLKLARPDVAYRKLDSTWRQAKQGFKLRTPVCRRRMPTF